MNKQELIKRANNLEQELALLKQEINKPDCKSIFDRLNNLSDLEKELGKSIEDIIPYKNDKHTHLPLTTKQKSLNVQAVLFELIELYNEGWKPDIANTSQKKYYLYKYFSGGSSGVEVDYCYYFYDASGLYFKNQEIGNKLKFNFPQLIEDYFM